MLDRLEFLLARALRRRAESARIRPLHIQQVRRRARQLLLAEQLSAALAILALIGVLWCRLGS